MLKATSRMTWQIEKISPNRVLIRAKSRPRLAESASVADRLTVVVVTRIPSIGARRAAVDARTLRIGRGAPHRPGGGLLAPPTTRSRLSPWVDDHALSTRLPS